MSEETTLIDPLISTDYPEIFIGLVGPIGVDLSAVYTLLEDSLRTANYVTKEIRLSDGLSEIKGLDIEIKTQPENERIDTLMKAGTALRKKSDRGDALALISLAQIRQIREELTGDQNKPFPKTAYILRSLKHKKEVESLRRIYGDLFFLISIYLPQKQRVENLSKKIADSKHDTNVEHYQPDALKLVQIDQKEEGTKYGQDVGGAFPLADLFIDMRSTAKAESSIKRFIEILFGYPYHTPNKDEFGMFTARANALRSADLSRQVGAAILSKTGSVIASGCNEVPKYNGGTYWSDDIPEKDHRDFRKGYDSSAQMKKDLIVEFIATLKEGQLLSIDLVNKQPTEIANDLIKSGAVKEILAANILEFGRIIHAEMAAITDAARLGLSLQSSVLYTTTFPCHMCARHIISSGITRVVYIEPYPKSKAAALYEEAIVVDSSHPTTDRIEFEPFVGIAPCSYMRLFHMVDRKDGEGTKIHWTASNSNPRFTTIMPSYITIEQNSVGFIKEIVSTFDLGNTP